MESAVVTPVSLTEAACLDSDPQPPNPNPNPDPDPKPLTLTPTPPGELQGYFRVQQHLTDAQRSSAYSRIAAVTPVNCLVTRAMVAV